METLVHCPGCKTPLRVPPTACGHRARCPSCKTHFVVPKPDELLEETFSTWIEQDVDDLFHQMEGGPQPTTAVGVETPPIARPAPASSSALKPPPAASAGAPRPADPRPDNEGPVVPPATPVQPPALPARPPRPTVAAPPRTSSPAPASPAAAIAPVTAAPPPPSTPTLAANPSPGSAARVDSAAVAVVGQDHIHYPTDLRWDSMSPRLVVLGVSPAGVTFAFDSIWLNHPGFRASMPMRCIFSGKAKREQLIARPIIFEDRCLTNKRVLEQALAAYEHRHLGDRTNRELADHMGELAHFATPFNQPMPYFVSTRHAHLSIFCLTRNRSGGGLTCEVLIPDPPTALEWLANVNGTCGPEHELLSREMGLLHGEAWRNLAEDTRQRLGVWCRLTPGEHFRLFLGDADFGRHDEGLGGLVLTDQRLIFNKYHHRGQVRLDENALVLVRSDEAFATLSLQTDSDRVRMVKLHAQDLPALLTALDRAPALRYELNGRSPANAEA
jgi:hypothetical protein